MKKILFIITIILTSVIFTNCVSAKSVTHYTDLFGDITFDIQELATQNNINITDNYILTKRTNGTDVVLILEKSDGQFFYEYASGSTSNINISNRVYYLNSSSYGFNYLNSYIFKYNSETNEFENNFFDSDVSNFNFNYEDIYYSTIDIKDYDTYYSKIDFGLNFLSFEDLKEDTYVINKTNNEKSPLSINEAYKNLIDKFNSQTKYDSYFIYTSNLYDYIEMFLYNKSTTYSVFNFYSNNTSMYIDYYLSKFSDYSNRFYYYDFSSSTMKNRDIGYSTIISINGSSYYIDKKNLFISSVDRSNYSSENNIYLSTNDSDLRLEYLSKDINLNIYDTNNYFKSIYNDNTLLFSEGQSILKKEPSITFENLVYSYDNDNNKIGASIDVVLSNIDNDKHLVQYSSKVNNDYYLSQGYVEQWIDIEDTTQPFNYSTSINDTLYVRIIDKQKYYDSVDKGEKLDIDVITASTLTFTGIEEITPYITYNITIPKECKISGIELGQTFSRSACQKLSAYIHNMDFNKYSLYYLESDNKIEYSDITEVTDTSNWSGLYATTFNKTYSTNKYVAIIVYDKVKNKVADVKLIKLDVVDIATSGFSIKFSSSYKNNGNYVDLKLTIYNDNNYIYFYSINSGIDYTEIKNISLVDDRMTIKNAHIPIYKNGQVLIKVVDTNGDVIGIYDTIISYDDLGETFSNSSPSSLIDYISNFVDSLKDYSTFFNRAFDLFFNGLPELVKMFIIVVWIIFLLFFAMQLGGWK